MQENLDAYIKVDINASARRVLFTKWMGQAWGGYSCWLIVIQKSKPDQLAERVHRVASFIKGGFSEESMISTINGIAPWLKTMVDSLKPHQYTEKYMCMFHWVEVHSCF